MKQQSPRVGTGRGSSSSFSKASNTGCNQGRHGTAGEGVQSHTTELDKGKLQIQREWVWSSDIALDLKSKS
ncbi:hypothetical protein CDL15_Pgr021018 [Punica granatum]|nr:hypothetical protein CDL15_Pgr021018 [Punica granatum]